MTNGNSGHFRRAYGTAQLFEQLARKVLERRSHHDLHASQWSALRYFSRASRGASNVSGLSRFLGNTSGSTSRTAKSLVEKGYLKTEPAAHDGRAVSISLTEDGRQRLADDPLHDLSKILAEALSPEDLAELGRILDQLGERLSPGDER